jgi:hypothetical protein
MNMQKITIVFGKSCWSLKNRNFFFKCIFSIQETSVAIGLQMILQMSLENFILTKEMEGLKNQKSKAFFSKPKMSLIADRALQYMSSKVREPKAEENILTQPSRHRTNSVLYDQNVNFESTRNEEPKIVGIPPAPVGSIFSDEHTESP